MRLMLTIGLGLFRDICSSAQASEELAVYSMIVDMGEERQERCVLVHMGPEELDELVLNLFREFGNCEGIEGRKVLSYYNLP